MRAPVYRNIEARNTLLGLAFPSEVLVVLSGFWVAMLLLPPGSALLASAAVYAGVRLASYGRAPLFLQHYLAWQFRRLYALGRISAASRTRAPRFPFAPCLSRDVPRRKP